MEKYLLPKKFLKYTPRIYLSNKGICSIKNLNIPLNVEILDLSYNNITSLKGIEKFTNLKYLIIDHNKIDSIIEIKKLVNLKYLDISNNEIKLLNGIEDLINLTSLCASHNKIKSLEMIVKLFNLVSLDINDNKIKSVAWIEKLINLNNLYFHNNPLVHIDKYNLIKYIGAETHTPEEADPNGVLLIYNYWQVKKYPQHLKQLIFDYYKLYHTNKYKNELIKNKMIKLVYGLN
jgi:Leucine-rich repeat (LRR) protein